MECVLINQDIKTTEKHFKKGELYVSSNSVRAGFIETIKSYIKKTGNKNIVKAISFIDIDKIFKKATKKSDFKNMIIFRFGGMGDLIALSSIIDYFDCNTHFVTDKRFFPIFDWFENKPILYSTKESLFTNFKKSGIKYISWAKFQGEGIIETGHNKNWFELFFDFVEENNPGKEFLRPQLITERINNNKSNIQKYSSGRKSILIANKATTMIRTCHVSDIFNSIPDKKDYDIFVHENNIIESDRDIEGLTIIPKTDFKTFLLDCYDVDMLISVDTGALHFREGINKPAIGLYNSFTTDSRTKHYQYTKSFDIKSECDLQPCFIHENDFIKSCPSGDSKMFAAPCFDSKHNKTLINQLTEIFKNELSNNNSVFQT
jgi:hypothetical protein